jgi:hypothetical protein
LRALSAALTLNIVTIDFEDVCDPDLPFQFREAKESGAEGFRFYQETAGIGRTSSA